MAKHVVSVSLGSSERDHVAEVELFGEAVTIERRGTDGSVKEAIRLISSLDGKVDAFGLGGIDRYIYAGGRRYTLREGDRIARTAQRSPIVDGSGLKDTLERWVIPYLQEQGLFSFAGKRILMVAAVDRFGMAEALLDTGADVMFGDVIFILGLPYPLKSLSSLSRLARVLAPVVVQLPSKWIYPTGERQGKSVPKYRRYYEWADMVAGDFHLIKRYMPENMEGKTILTNTVTPRDIEDLRRRGVATLITTTPDLGGRSFGTNVVEAALVAVSGSNGRMPDPGMYLDLLQRLGFAPRIVQLTS
ncbi:MAG: quinate 5-dehydrogenase [Firmicutes bacterium]|nr:quinate 5-dehydrogenase [Bacillota bacterium]